MKFLRGLFMWGVLLASLGLLYYVSNIRYVACETPLEYRIGKVDSRFGISEEELKDVVESATSVWEDRANKNFFVYDLPEETPKNELEAILKKYIDKYYTRSPIVINLIYDERQERANENKNLSVKIDSTKSSAEDLKNELEDLQNKHKVAEVELEVMMGEYKKGGGDRKEIEDKVGEVNALVDRINVLVKEYNSLVKEVNTNVEVINMNAGYEYEEGEFVADESGERINIYEFEDRHELLKVMTHELGHALGLDHNEDPESVMYYLNQGDNIYPTDDDVKNLKMICKEE